jgi:hypothetical protein
MHHTHIELDPVRGAKLKKALADMLRRHRANEANAGAPWNELEVDSFLNGIDRAVTTKPTTTKPVANATVSSEPGGIGASGDGSHGHSCCDHRTADDSNGNPGSPTDLRVPEIGVIIDLHTLVDGLHEQSICETYDGTRIPLAEVRRMCCDADIIPYVLNGDSEVTDLGRSTRTVNRAQRRKLRALHKTCVGDGCLVGFEQCEIHHVIFWRFKGRSDIDNLVPVCSRHHHLAHEGRWTLTMTPDRIVTWTRPDGTTHSVHKPDNRLGAGQAKASRTGAKSSRVRTTK